MDGFFSFVGILTIIAAVTLLLLHYYQNNEKEKEDNRDLAQHYDVSNLLDGRKNYDQNIKRIFSDPSVRKKAEEERIKFNEHKTIKAENERKEIIKKRVYSYKYEDVVYEIFSPYREVLNSGSDRKEWSVYVKLENDFVIKEICRILNVGLDEGNKLFNEFKENDMLYVGFAKGMERSKKCELGPLLKTNWNIISRDDKNFSKWIEGHQNLESKEEADIRRLPFDIRNYYSLEDFIEENGKFELENRYSGLSFSFIMHFSYCDKKVLVSTAGLGFKRPSKTEVIGKYIEEHKHLLLIVEEDGFYHLKMSST